MASGRVILKRLLQDSLPSVLLMSLMTDNICHPKFNREFQHIRMQEEISAGFCTEVG